MKANTQRKLIALALVLITLVAMTAALAITADASETATLEFTEQDASYNEKCGLVRLKWTKVTDAAYYVVYFDGEFYKSVYTNYINRSDLEIGREYAVSVVAIRATGDESAPYEEIIGANASTVITPEHDYTTYYSDETGHWCSCGISEKVDHVGGTATCSNQAVCEVCGTSYGELDADNHENTVDEYCTDNSDGTHSVRYVCCSAVKSVADHTYTYTSSESTITAKCDLCEYESSVTLYAPVGSLVYDGSVNAAIVSSNAFGLTEDDVVYEKDGAVVSAPATVGDYTASLTLGTETVTVSFTVTKAIVAVPYLPTLTYNGSVQTSGLTDTETYTVVADNGGKDVGTYCVTLKLTDAENYAWSDSSEAEIELSYDIAPATVAIPSADNTVYTYTGEEITYVIASSDNYTVSGSKETDAGSYTVTVSLNDKANFVWSNGSSDDLEYSFVINKASASIIVDRTPIEITYGEALTVPTAEAGSFGSVEVSVKDASGVIDDYSKLDAGIYYIDYVIKGTDNYYGANVLIDVTVNKAQASVVVDSSDINLTYGDTLVPPTASTNGLGTVTHTVTDASGNEITELTKLDAGKYFLNYTIDGADNYYGDSVKVNVVIAPKGIDEPTAIGTYTYNGQRQEVSLQGVIDEIMSVSGHTTAKGAGTYYVYADITDDNYVWADGSDGEITWTIGKKLLTVTVQDASAEQYTDMPVFLYGTDGFVDGDAFETEPTLFVIDDSTEKSGEFTIYAEDAYARNYSVEYEYGTLTVTPHTECRGGTATCTAKAVCSICGKEYGELLPHTYDEGVITAPTCTEKGYTRHTCEVCGYYYDDAITDALGHTVTVDAAVAPSCTETGLTEGKHCSVCNEVLVAQTVVDALGHTEVTDEAVAPSCTETGLTEGKHCSVCGEVLVAQNVVDALGHTEVTDEAKAPTCTETGLTDGKHCSVCNEVLIAQNVVDALGHTYESVVTAPTCTKDGYTTYTCHCGDTYVADEVDATGHTYESVVTAPTCTEDGYTTYTCSCGDTYKDDETAALGHKPGADATCTADKACTVCGVILEEAFGHTYESVVTPPTCTEDGYTTYTCHCGDTYTEDGEDAGHTIVVDEAVAPTCTEDGLTEGSHCSVCNEILIIQDVDNKLGHDKINHEAKEPTCTEVGWKAYDTCSRCDYTTYEEIQANGHNHNKVLPAEPPTCTEAGLTEGRACSVCDEVMAPQNVVDALGHRVVVDKAIAPTCTETGLTEGRHCDRCEAVLTAQTVVPALGHTYESVVTPPTCEDGGYTTYTCQCGDTYVADEVAATGHTPGAEATCTTNQKCTVCDEVIVSKYGHTPGAEATCTEAQYCTVCDAVVKSALGHAFDKLESEIAPTCTHEGSKIYSCTRCLEINTVIVAPTGHSGGVATCCEYAICEVCDVYYGDYAPCEYTWTYAFKDGKHLHTGVCAHDEDHNVVDALCYAEKAPITLNAGTYVLVIKGISYDAVFNVSCDNGTERFDIVNLFTKFDTVPTVSGKVSTATAEKYVISYNEDDQCFRVTLKLAGGDYCFSTSLATESMTIGTKGAPETTYKAIEDACAGCVTDLHCGACGEVIEAQRGHTPGAEATCTEAQTCTVCGDELVPAKGHTYCSSCTENVYCTECNVLIAEAPGHTYSAKVMLGNKCTKCGAVSYLRIALRILIITALAVLVFIFFKWFKAVPTTTTPWFIYGSIAGLVVVAIILALLL